MDDPPINLVRHIRGHTADHIRPTVENGEDSVLDLLKGEAKGWYDTTTSTLKTDAVADFTTANSEYFTSPTGTGPDTNFSISTWVKFDTVTGSPGIASTYRATPSLRGPGLVLTASSEIRFFGFYQNGGSLETADCISPAVTTGIWYHVVATFDGSEMILYVNNTKYATTWSSAGQDRSDEDFWYIGSSRFLGYSDAKQQMFGSWSRAISEAEVTALYNSGTPREYAGLTTSEKVDMVAFWHMNEPSGTRYDAHGSNDLTDNNTVGVATGPVEYTATENAAITKWENQAGNASSYSNGTRAAASNSPYVSGGLPRFTGAPGLTVTGATLTQPNVIWAVVTNNSTGIYRRIVGWFNTTGADPSQLLYVTVPSTTARIYAGAAAVGNTATTLGVRHSQAAEFNSTSSKMYLDGAVDKTTNAGTNSAGSLVIGNDDGANPTYGWLGTIELVLLLDRALTAAEITALGTL